MKESISAKICSHCDAKIVDIDFEHAVFQVPKLIKFTITLVNLKEVEARMLLDLTSKQYFHDFSSKSHEDRLVIVSNERALEFFMETLKKVGGYSEEYIKKNISIERFD